MPSDEPPLGRGPGRPLTTLAASYDPVVVDDLPAMPAITGLELSIIDTYLADVVDELLDSADRSPPASSTHDKIEGDVTNKDLPSATRTS
jgi:hypothetical protein